MDLDVDHLQHAEARRCKGVEVNAVCAVQARVSIMQMLVFPMTAFGLPTHLEALQREPKRGGLVGLLGRFTGAGRYDT